MQYTFNVKSWGKYEFSYECESEDMQEVSKHAASCVGCQVDDLELISKKTDIELLLGQLPPEFAEWAHGYAYEHGHWAGDNEIKCVLQDVVDGLSEAITKFRERLNQGSSMRD